MKRIVIIILLAAAVAALGYGGWKLKKGENWETYVNEGHGFSLTFTDAWKGYRVVEARDETVPSIKTFTIGVPTTARQWQANGGYFDVLFLAVYPLVEWQKLAGVPEDSKPRFIAEHNSYVFTYLMTQEPIPSDKTGLAESIDAVTASFRAN